MDLFDLIPRDLLETWHQIEPFVGMGFLALMVLYNVVFLARMVRRLFGGRRPAKRSCGTGLDTVLMYWTPNKYDQFTVRDLLSGGVLITGRPGSGKTSSSFQLILQSCINLSRSGGLILAASQSDLEMVRRAFAGRQDRLVIFEQRGEHRFNVVDYILVRGGSTKDILTAIYAIVESVARTSLGGGQGGDDGSFFAVGAKRIIEYAVVVVKHAFGSVSPSNLIQFLNTAASSLAEVHGDAFRDTFHYKCLKDGFDKEKSSVEAFDYEQARTFFTMELVRMADRTRTSLLAVVFNILHAFNSGTNRLLFATDTTVTPSVMDEGKWVFVNMPVSRHGQEGAFALGVWKWATEWHVLRRDSSRDNPPLIIAVDEFHNTVNSFDTQFLSESRKFAGCIIACTQSKASFYANMGGESAEAQVDALVNNFSHKIFHAIGDIRTAEWASQLCGTALQFNLGGSEQSTGSRSLLDEWFGNYPWGGSLSETMRPVVEPRAFMHGLRTGGPKNNYLCDAWVIRSGEPFASTGDNFLPVVFRQPELR